MKQGRELYAKSRAAGCAPHALRKLTGRELAAVIHYAEGLGDGEDAHEVIGAAVIEAADRYLKKVEKKARKRQDGKTQDTREDS